MLTLQTPIENFLRVGKTTAKRLQKLGLRTAEDLLFYFPFRYEDWSKITPIGELNYNMAATCRGRVEIIKNTRSFFRKKNVTEALVSDRTGSIKVVWFNQPYLVKILKIGEEIYLSGKVELDRFGIHFTSPSYEKVGSGEETTHTARIVPIYSATENLTHKQIRFLVKMAVPLADKISDWLLPEIKKNFRLVGLGQAIRQAHFPDSKIKFLEARRRLKFDELFLIQLQNLLLKNRLKKSQAPVIGFKEVETKKFINSLPFKLTDGQRRAAWEIIQDIGTSQPMNRLLEGDVGSGKTLVAAVAALNTYLGGYQTVFMVPTEILAKQHYDNLCRLFSDFDIKIGLVMGSEKVANYELEIMDEELIKNKRKKEIHNSEFIIHNSNLVIGTHALIQEKIKFNNLGLAIVDEQHRFGVNQRKALKGNTEIYPHFLSMTATPIPRTMSLVFFGDLDLSMIRELPAGRKKIITKVVSPENRRKAYDFIRREIKGGRQVFVICPLIDPSDKLGVKSVSEEYEKLSKKIFPDLKVGILHGRMKAEDKAKAMKDFSENKSNILVSTSVVEVGVDVQNATIMMVEGAERFGLAQLHQFRGRVGRSTFQSYCFLFSESENIETIKRLDVLVKCEDGFALAEKDLEFRGPGEIWGTRQSGIPDLKVATLTDYQVIKETKTAAENLIKKDPELSAYPDLKNKLWEFEKEVHLE
jgi:ATP-dependent DNA helicase RecG